MEMLSCDELRWSRVDFDGGAEFSCIVGVLLRWWSCVSAYSGRDLLVE